MIEELKLKRGNVFRATVYGANGKRKAKNFPNKTLAKEWERRALRERDEQEATGLSAGSDFFRNLSSNTLTIGAQDWSRWGDF